MQIMRKTKVDSKFGDSQPTLLKPDGEDRAHQPLQKELGSQGAVFSMNMQTFSLATWFGHADDVPSIAGSIDGPGLKQH